MKWLDAYLNFKIGCVNWTVENIFCLNKSWNVKDCFSGLPSIMSLSLPLTFSRCSRTLCLKSVNVTATQRAATSPSECGCPQGAVVGVSVTTASITLWAAGASAVALDTTATLPDPSTHRMLAHVRQLERREGTNRQNKGFCTQIVVFNLNQIWLCISY